MATISVKLPSALDAKLAAAAKRRRTTKAAVVREAIDTYLNGRHKPLKKGSFLELAGDMIGRLEGPGDLSYNSEHMRDFGK